MGTTQAATRRSSRGCASAALLIVAVPPAFWNASNPSYTTPPGVVQSQTVSGIVLPLPRNGPPVVGALLLLHAMARRASPQASPPIAMRFTRMFPPAVVPVGPHCRGSGPSQPILPREGIVANTDFRRVNEAPGSSRMSQSSSVMTKAGPFPLTRTAMKTQPRTHPTGPADRCSFPALTVRVPNSAQPVRPLRNPGRSVAHPHPVRMDRGGGSRPGRLIWAGDRRHLRVRPGIFPMAPAQRLWSALAGDIHRRWSQAASWPRRSYSGN